MIRPIPTPKVSEQKARDGKIGADGGPRFEVRPFPLGSQSNRKADNVVSITRPLKTH
ncbi:hypothetical protein SAMN05216242_10956 [Thauera chlorobenzoica]|nr:hypothetical protein SAMN05216242_10956 [Thauera chlorobenzoica]